MKKIVLGFLLFFAAATASCQWQPHNPTGLIRDTANLHILVDQFWLDISGRYAADVVLYDSIGHLIADWKGLDLREKEERYAYHRIWKHIVEVKGWIRINGIDIPTVRKEEETWLGQ